MLNRRGFLGSIAGCAALAVVPLGSLAGAPDWIDVRDFGAIGDGVADDTAAIQAALDTKPRSVFFPAGTYRCNLTLPAGTNMVGSADSAPTLRGVTNDPVIRVVSGPSSITNFCLECGPANVGILFGNV